MRMAEPGEEAGKARPRMTRATALGRSRIVPSPRPRWGGELPRHDLRGDRPGDVVSLEELRRGSLEADLTLLHEHGSFADLTGHPEALLDDNQCHVRVIRRDP
jgi:hypothetical protein